MLQMSKNQLLKANFKKLQGCLIKIIFIPGYIRFHHAGWYPVPFPHLHRSP